MVALNLSATFRRRIALWALCLLFVAPNALADLRYVVRRNDTLSSIARKHGISVSSLVRHNQLRQANRLFPGDVLRIPSTQARTSNSSSALEPGLASKLDRIRVETGKWKFLVIHHSATDGGNAQGMDRYHREERNMENGLAYHFLIGNGRGMADGEIAIGRRWLEQLNGGHLASESLNEKSIGICLVGNFDVRRPTPKQMASLEILVNYLMRRCQLNRSALKTHQQINPIHTRCPGRHFPSKNFAKQIAANR